MKSKIVLPFALLFTALLLFTSCKKDKTTQADFNYLGEWTVNYNFTTGSMARGVFKATLKSDGKWDYVEGSNSRGNAGTWTYSGNSISFEFNFSGLAKYDGTKISDNRLSGTGQLHADPLHTRCAGPDYNGEVLRNIACSFRLFPDQWPGKVWTSLWGSDQESGQRNRICTLAGSPRLNTAFPGG